MSRKLAKIDPRKLIKHPTSLKLYGEKADDGFDESIAARGADEPIVVAADGKTIVSGVRRSNGLIKAGCKLTDIIIRKDLVNDLDVREAIIEANRHNEQTMESKARVFIELKAIEEERAAERQKAGVTLRPNLDEGKTSGRSDDIAAAKVGLKRTNALKAAEVVQKIDAATESGKVTTAADLSKSLNEESVKKAHEVSVPSERYQAAFSKLPKSVTVLIKEKPSLASEACVLKMATMEHDELGQVARSIRIGDVKRFDDVVKPSKNGAAKEIRKKPPMAQPSPNQAQKDTAKPAPKQTAKQFADALIKDHIRPLAKGLDQLAKLTGEKGKDHVAGVSALDRVLTSVTKMGAR